MRFRLLSCLVAALFVMLCPRPASAAVGAGFFTWVDSLSGPGPFHGGVYDAMFVCYGTPREIGERESPEPHLFLDAGCIESRRDRFRVSIGVQLAALVSEHNNLPYSPARAGQPTVHAYPAMAVADVGFFKGIDFGAGLGYVRFSGDGFGFWRFIVEPRVTIKPFALLSKGPNPSKRADLIELKIFATGIPGGMEAKDFGATGTWSSSGEFQKGFIIGVNFAALAR